MTTNRNKVEAIRKELIEEITSLMVEFRKGSGDNTYQTNYIEMFDQAALDGRIEGLSIKSPDGIKQILTVDVRFERTELNEKETPIEKLCADDLLSLYEDLDHYMDTRDLDDDGADDDDGPHDPSDDFVDSDPWVHGPDNDLYG